MKTKKLHPLKLSKETIANLGNNEMSKVKGGACSLEWSGCDSLVRPCCTWDLETSCTETLPYCVETALGC